MPKQRNLSQMKEQDKVKDRNLSETDISNMPDGDFKATIIKILTEHWKRMEDIRETLTTKIKGLKNNQR